MLWEVLPFVVVAVVLLYLLRFLMAELLYAQYPSRRRGFLGYFFGLLFDGPSVLRRRH